MPDHSDSPVNGTHGPNGADGVSGASGDAPRRLKSVRDGYSCRSAAPRVKKKVAPAPGAVTLMVSGTVAGGPLVT